jgi:hypothetical protein
VSGRQGATLWRSSMANNAPVVDGGSDMILRREERRRRGVRHA